MAKYRSAKLLTRLRASFPQLGPGRMIGADGSEETKPPHKPDAILFVSDVDLFTDNEAMRAYLRDDPFRLQAATARLFFASRRLDWMLRRMPRGGIRAATNLLLARRDRIINNAATQQVVARFTDGRAATRIIEGCHTMDFEPNPHEFLDALVAAVGRAD